MSLIAFAALIASAILTNAFEREDSGTVHDVMQVAKPIIIASFAVSGLAALAFSLSSLKRGERSIIVWAALAVGLFATTLMIGEFTVLE
jgi:hypothetical protein